MLLRVTRYAYFQSQHGLHPGPGIPLPDAGLLQAVEGVGRGPGGRRQEGGGTGTGGAAGGVGRAVPGTVFSAVVKLHGCDLRLGEIPLVEA